MLDQNDLQQIRGVVREETTEVVHKIVPGIVHGIVYKAVKESEDRVISAMGDMIEQNVLPQIDGLREEMHRELSYIRAKMVTKMDLEDRLADFRVALLGSI